jgi:hypothetical protein
VLEGVSDYSASLIDRGRARSPKVECITSGAKRSHTRRREATRPPALPRWARHCAPSVINAYTTLWKAHFRQALEVDLVLP